MASNAPAIFTVTSAVSLTGVAVAGAVGYFASRALLPKHIRWQDKYAFIWLTFDGIIHLTLEASFLYYSTFGRTVNTGTGPMAQVWREYAAADFRWGVADPTVVALEILTVFGAGPMALYIAYQIAADDPARHYWIVVISTAELYGGWMTFCPEWLTGSPNLETSNFLYLWVYLFFMNVIWVIIPLGLMYDSYGFIATAVRKTQAQDATKKAQ
ncbi:Emopamil-binding protein [Vararia minispora EC-137]|uniref:Emopamil-binding protein n=1 Tax=Vararia minispora EC-137 TaxID=1314806 RepID=A0ACB8QL75_9AGAM|nr:Emopamil-binding protein [Vararia minispora EC-137]